MRAKRDGPPGASGSATALEEALTYERRLRVGSHRQLAACSELELASLLNRIQARRRARYQTLSARTPNPVRTSHPTDGSAQAPLEKPLFGVDAPASVSESAPAGTLLSFERLGESIGAQSGGGTFRERT